MLKLLYRFGDCLRFRGGRAGWSGYLIEFLRVLVLIASTAILAFFLVDALQVQLHMPAEFTVPCVGVAVLANLGIYLASLKSKPDS